MTRQTINATVPFLDLIQIPSGNGVRPDGSADERARVPPSQGGDTGSNPVGTTRQDCRSQVEFRLGQA
jgi:hypothetical protein